jgi:hypothetical protein
VTERRRLVIEEIDDPASPWFGRAMSLSARIFPPKEQLDQRELEELLLEKRLGLLYPSNVHFLVAHRANEFSGFAQGSYLAGPNVCFVSYLAVRPSRTRGRVGPLLRQRLIFECRRDAIANRRRDIWAVVGEVEHKNPWLRTLVRSRGVIALDIAYEQPPLSAGGSPVPLTLYVQRRDRAVASMRAREVRALVYAIYRNVYRIRFPTRHESFQRIIASIGGRNRVGQIDLHGDSHRPAH